MPASSVGRTRADTATRATLATRPRPPPSEYWMAARTRERPPPPRASPPTGVAAWPSSGEGPITAPG